MLVELFTPYAEMHGFFNLFTYLTFRTGGALTLGFLLSVWIGESAINRLQLAQGQGQPIRQLELDRQLEKQGTPTMGGLIVWFGLFASVLIWADLRNPYIWIVLLLTLCFAAVGFADDHAKISEASSEGVSARTRLLIEFFVAGLACAFILGLHGAHTPAGHAQWGPLNPLAQWIAGIAPQTGTLPNDPAFAGGVALPFVSGFPINLGPFFILFGMVVIVGWANAVNFTDGLDGLAIVPGMFAAGAYALIAYLTGNFVFANYLGLQFIPGAGELAVLMGALLGAAMGFLWYNTHPAQVFMGDTGALGLGGLLGVVAVAVKHEFALLIIGGLFLLEILSVVTQVGWFKFTRHTTGQGQRIFKMAPLHHHFQKAGWPETRIVVRFWILSALFALAGLATLKLR